MKAWVARDKNNMVFMFTSKPFKFGHEWVASGRRDLGTIIDEINLPSDIEPLWSDEEPIEVETTIKRVKPNETFQS